MTHACDPYHDPATHRQVEPPARWPLGSSAGTIRAGRDHPYENYMSLTIDHGHERHDQIAPPPTDAWGAERTVFAPPEAEESFEEIER